MQGPSNYESGSEDQTGNYVEIWTEAAPVEGGDALRAEDFDIQIDLPDGRRVDLGAPQFISYFPIGGDGRSGNAFAQVYCQVFSYPDAPTPRRRIRFLIAVRPTPDTHDLKKRRPTAPAGLWRIGLCCTARDVRLDLNVQTDQARFVHSRTSLASYFDPPDCLRFDAMGRPLDSDDGGAPATCTVRRFGMVNALFSTAYATTIGGCRRADGVPATYSATGHGDGDAASQLRRAEVAFPSDDGAAHPGVLGAGSSEGSCVPLRGTSMASALSTRRVMEALLAPPARVARGPDPTYGRDWFCGLATAFEARRPQAYRDAPQAKVGGGRVACAARGRAVRMENLAPDGTPR